MKYLGTSINEINTDPNIVGPNAMTAAQISDLVLNLNNQSPNLGGWDPLKLLMTNKASGLSKDQIIDHIKDNMINGMYDSLQSAPINPLILSYATQGGVSGSLVQPGPAQLPLSREQIIFSQFPDPLGTILRLRKGSTAQQATAKRLMRQMVSRNVLGDDPYMADLLVQGDKDALKDYLFAKQLENADPYMKTILYRKFKPGTAGINTGALTDNTELLKTKMIADQFGDKVNQVAPNDAYMMFKFLRLSSDQNGGEIPANIILDIALGTDVADIKSSEFQENFGVQSAEFVCAAHHETIRVPCMVNQQTVTQEECASQGCCFNRLLANPIVANPNRADSTVPVCYHNLLGRIGNGLAHHMINDDHVKALFGGSLPKLEDLTAAQTWAETMMPEGIRRLAKQEGSFYGQPAGQAGWFANLYDSTEKNFNIFPTAAPGRREFEWREHGPTALPQAGNLQIPEIGGILDEQDSRVAQLDFIIGNHVEKLRGELNSKSYTCTLIPKENMVNCYDNNFEALKGVTPEADCNTKGCCYREINLFEKDNLPVCYRSLRAGYCDIEYSTRASTAVGASKANDWWFNNPYRSQCGAAGSGRGECLMNPQCCFDTDPRRDGDPHCYKRGGIESLYSQRSREMESQCALTAVPLRQYCFDNTNKLGTLLNKVANEDQCIQAGCCYDENAANASKALYKEKVFGTMANLAGPHCFRRPDGLDNTDTLANNYDLIEKIGRGSLVKVCATVGGANLAANPQWPSIKQRKWEQDVNDKWILSDKLDRRAVLREQCVPGETPDRHTCVYTHGCCYQKSSDPNEPWCYKSRMVPECFQLNAGDTSLLGTTCP